MALAIATALGATGEELTEVRRLASLERPDPHWWARSGYLQKVRDIAPDGRLRDRDDELALMTAFCAGSAPYLWWQADPWAGKSALLSAFVLDPPPATDVVSFFITGRLAAEADSSACVDALIDQLAALIGEKPPASVSALSRDADRRRLLRMAADRAAEAGRRLVLVVDGLDEDTGARPGTGLASVAAILPKAHHDALRVIVASRPSPALPADVPPDHPLRRCRPMLLGRSPSTTSARRPSQRGQSGRSPSPLLPPTRTRWSGRRAPPRKMATAGGSPNWSSAPRRRSPRWTVSRTGPGCSVI
jgi:hypothetical protein